MTSPQTKSLIPPLVGLSGVVLFLMEESEGYSPVSEFALLQEKLPAVSRVY
jgi:hypothetical protein